MPCAWCRHDRWMHVRELLPATGDWSWICLASPCNGAHCDPEVIEAQDEEVEHLTKPTDAPYALEECVLEDGGSEGCGPTGHCYCEETTEVIFLKGDPGCYGWKTFCCRCGALGAQIDPRLTEAMHQIPPWLEEVLCEGGLEVWQDGAGSVRVSSRADETGMRL